MATITKTFTFTADQAVVEARAKASAAMTPQESCRAMMVRQARATSRDFVYGRVF